MKSIDRKTASSKGERRVARARKLHGPLVRDLRRLRDQARLGLPAVALRQTSITVGMLVDMLDGWGTERGERVRAALGTAADDYHRFQIDEGTRHTAARMGISADALIAFANAHSADPEQITAALDAGTVPATWSPTEICGFDDAPSNVICMYQWLKTRVARDEKGAE